MFWVLQSPLRTETVSERVVLYRSRIQIHHESAMMSITVPQWIPEGYVTPWLRTVLFFQHHDSTGDQMTLNNLHQVLLPSSNSPPLVLF
jgi:hypothetical protein